MGHRFADLTFTQSVREVQEALGSRAVYARMEGREDHNCLLGERESSFIQARDSFYMATVSETGWPYVQHRGGPLGFLRVLDERTIGFADFGGNRQFVTVGNVRRDNRVALFFMDYPNRKRLKMLGRVQLLDVASAQFAALAVQGGRARNGTGLARSSRSVRLELSATHYSALYRSGDRAAPCAAHRGKSCAQSATRGFVTIAPAP